MKSEFKYAGWQVGITYQTKDEAGLDKPYLRNIGYTCWVQFQSGRVFFCYETDTRGGGYRLAGS